MVDIRALQKQWLEDRPRYETLCQNFTQILKAETRSRGIPCEVHSRTKEPDSLVKKALRKGYGDPYRDIRDKAGIRVVCKYKQELSQVEAIVREHFDVSDRDDKAESLDFDQLGYSGIHFEARLRRDEGAVDVDVDELTCEVQLMTKAQGFWAEISHELVYKPIKNPREDVKRIVYLQSALIEIFDNQMEQARQEFLSTQGFQEALMLHELDKQFFRLVGRGYDRELSLQVIEALCGLFSEEEIRTFGILLGAFVEQNEELLRQLFESYGTDERKSTLLFQPESLVIFMCMDRDPFSLKSAWAKHLPLELLEDLAGVWGKDIG